MDDKVNIPDDENIIDESELEVQEVEDNDEEEVVIDEELLNLDLFPEDSKSLSTGRIPTPVPFDVDTSLTPMEESLSSDTIAMKPPVKTSHKPSLEEAAEEEPPKEEAPESKKLKIFCYQCEQKLDLTNMEPFSELDCPSCSAKIIVPKWFDNYLLEEVAGIGGMAKVYRGLDLALDREIAVKILDTDNSNNDQGKLFLHEARTAATLNHFALLPIYTCGQCEDKPYFVMQYMGGGSLEQEILNLDEDDSIPVKKIIRWMIDAAEGLDNARRHGIIHHDVKPGNFLLDSEGSLKIGDFGISQALFDSRSEEISELTKMWASPDYVSPEKITTKQETYLGDIYSLGATFYHILTGHNTFDYDTYEELLKAKTIRDPLDIRKLRADIPDPLAGLIMSMLSRTPEARPSYRDIIAELNALKGGTTSLRRSKAKKGTAKIGGKKKKKEGVNFVAKKGRAKSTLGGNIRKQSNLPNQIITLIFILALFGVGYYLWDNGYFDQFLSKSASEGQNGDYLKDVTERLAAGDSGSALMLADVGLNSVSLSRDGKRQAALQLAIATYLENVKNAKNRCSLISERLKSSGIEMDDPYMIILRYLSAGKIAPDNLREQLSEDEHLKSVGEIAIFVKEAYNKGKVVNILDAYRNYSSNIDSLNDEFWGRQSFIDRINVWHDWIFLGKYTSKLEPFIKASAKSIAAIEVNKSKEIARRRVGKTTATKKSKSQTNIKLDPTLSLKNLSADWLKKHSSFASARPRPKDLTFVDSAIQSYLDGLPKKYQAIESERVNQISPLKGHLCSMMLHMSYGITTIKRRRGRPVTGTIMANKNYISVRPSNNKRVRIMWKEIHFDQFVTFLDHYVKLRGNSDAGTTVSKSKQRREAAWGYLRIAILCDWYGQYKDAVKYTLRAVGTDPGIKDEAILYMMQ